MLLATLHRRSAQAMSLRRGVSCQGGCHYSERGNEVDVIDVEIETKYERLSLRLAHWFKGRSLDSEFSTEHHANLIVEFGCSIWDNDILAATRFREDVHYLK